MQKSISYILTLLSLSVSITLNAEVKKLVILQTTDIHGYIQPTTSHSGKEQGWLKIATLIDNEREISQKDNVLLIDCGDTLQGTIDVSATKGMIAAEMLNLLKYDAWIIGNHDYDYGYQSLKKICSYLKMDIYAANLVLDKKHKLPIIPWKIYTKNGVRVAVIGMTSPGLNNWLWGKKLSYLKVNPISYTFAKLIPEVLKAKPDMIVLAVHFGLFGGDEFEINQVSRTIRRFPQIDLVLGGHIHKQEPGIKVGPSTWFARSGPHAQNLLKVEIEVDTVKHKLINICSKLIEVKKTTKINPVYKKRIDRYRQTIQKDGFRKCGELTTPAPPLSPKKYHSIMTEIIGRAVTESAECKLAIHGNLSPYTTLSGKLNNFLLFKAAPYEDTVATLMLDVSQIKNIIDEQIKVIDKNRFQSPFGMSVILDKDNKTVRDILIDGKKLLPGEKVKIAFNTYSVAGAGGKFPILKAIASDPNNRPNDTGILVRDALRNYIVNHSPLSVKMKEWIRTE